ncbi:MAG: hypothetical protein WCO79_02895 [bacterium]
MSNEEKVLEKNIEVAYVEIQELVAAFRLLPSDCRIERPDRLLLVGELSPEVSRALGVPRTVLVSLRSLKHIVERRGEDAMEIVQDIPKILSHPTKVVDNSTNRPSSYLFVRMNGKAKAVVLEITKTPDGNRVVSAFFVDAKTYKKLKDISGRSDVPPLDVSPVESISTAQKL